MSVNNPPTNRGFHYQNNQLYCEDVRLADLAAAVGTPVYVYSQATILAQARAYLANAPANSLVCYAVKANGNPAILKLLAAAGLGADVTSGGELFLAQHAGFAPEKIIYSGVGKLRHEIEAALNANIHALHVESAMELELVAEIAAVRQQIVPIGVRVNPDIQVETHPHISTGAAQHKFGVSPETAVSLFHFAAQHPWLKPVGLATHIGSQIKAIEPFKASANFLVGLADELSSSGIRLDYLDVGGGLGVEYEGSKWRVASGESDNQALLIEAWVRAVSEPVQAAGYGLVMEPGRSVMAAAGMLLTQVVYTKVVSTKPQGKKQFAIVDAAMNDLLRPVLYSAYHEILPLDLPQRDRGKEVVYDVVGPICETSDFLAKERPLPSLTPGDLLAISHAGAYGFAMSSNYNGRLRPAETLVSGQHHHPIRQRQTYQHLLDGVA
ncbi:Diaminopimelate decarboxylase [hydrothermal vent metagenome]|uniref:Diaminopimelate decarboxylase n=1 Tax=hydrothermal vent metagenome TaxID=652676 RepID=A0A3B0VFH1_9ZZZZ